MSHKVIRYLYCDGPLCEGSDEPFDHAPSPDETITAQRERARRFDWTHVQGKDYCDECAESQLKRKSNAK